MKTKSLILFLAIVPFLFSSCKKDDDDNRKNAFTIGATEYILDNGAAVFYGITVEDGAYNFDIYLFSSDIDYYAETGTGDRVYFELFSETFEDIQPGTYTFDANGTGNAGTFGRGIKSVITTNYNVLTEVGTSHNVNSGTLQVSVSGDVYTFDFDLVLSDNTKVDGYFKGELTKIDF